LDIGYHFLSFDAIFSQQVKGGLATVYVGHSCTLHVSVELIILYQPALARRFD